MKPIICALLLLVSTVIRSRISLQLEIVALRHQLAVYQRTTKRPRIGSGDRILWTWLSRHWSGWRDALVFVQTGTVIAWQRKRFRDHWAKLSKHGNLPKKPVRLIGVGVSDWKDSQPAQADLFDNPEQRQDNQRLLKIIDDVTEKFGQGMLQVGAGRNAGK